MAFDKRPHELDLNKPMDSWIYGVLMGSTRMRRFVTGSFAYSGQPENWGNERDRDIVICDDDLDEEFRIRLAKEFPNQGAQEYEDFSIYFKLPDGPLFNFITLEQEKFVAWKLATELVTHLVDKNADWKKWLMESRSNRVDIFVKVESIISSMIKANEIFIE